jgi:IrrE N-terminal-like domain
VSGVLKLDGLRERERCLDLVRALPVPRPFELEPFRVALGRRRGRPLRFAAAQVGEAGTSGGPAPDGLWIATTSADYIFYNQGAAPLRQLYIIAREIGHMVFGHEGGPASASEIARLVLPALDPGLVLSTLGRTTYTTAEENEAELFAVMLLDHME